MRNHVHFNRMHLAQCVLVALIWPALVASSKAARRANTELHTVASGPTDADAAARGLLDTTVSAVALVQEGDLYHGAGAAEKRFPGPVLAYVTPWNSGGYATAVKFRAKLDWVSPVWYQLRTDPQGALAVVGGHEHNATWLAELRAAAPPQPSAGEDADVAPRRPPPRVVPRVVVELTPQETAPLLGRPGPAIERLVAEASGKGYDGLVLEAWNTWAGWGGFDVPEFSAAAAAFVTKLGASLHAEGLQLLLAVPPLLPAAQGRPWAQREQLAALLRAGDVDALSLMLYDHASSAPGPNAPLPWQEANLVRLMQGDPAAGEAPLPADAAPKALLGLPFYGWDFQRHVKTRATDVAAVTGPGFLAALARHLPEVAWDAGAGEHRVAYREGRMRHEVWFPTPAMLAARVELATRLGVGLSIWELGQGMDSFFDLL